MGAGGRAFMGVGRRAFMGAGMASRLLAGESALALMGESALAGMGAGVGLASGMVALAWGAGVWLACWRGVAAADVAPAEGEARTSPGRASDPRDPTHHVTAAIATRTQPATATRSVPLGRLAASSEASSAPRVGSAKGAAVVTAIGEGAAGIALGRAAGEATAIGEGAAGMALGRAAVEAVFGATIEAICEAWGGASSVSSVTSIARSSFDGREPRSCASLARTRPRSSSALRALIASPKEARTPAATRVVSGSFRAATLRTSVAMAAADRNRFSGSADSARITTSASGAAHGADPGIVTAGTRPLSSRVTMADGCRSGRNRRSLIASHSMTPTLYTSARASAESSSRSTSGARYALSRAREARRGRLRARRADDARHPVQPDDDAIGGQSAVNQLEGLLPGVACAPQGVQRAQSRQGVDEDSQSRLERRGRGELPPPHAVDELTDDQDLAAANDDVEHSSDVRVVEGRQPSRVPYPVRDLAVLELLSLGSLDHDESRVGARE